MNLDHVALSSSRASLKVIDSGSGGIVAPLATSVNSPQSTTITIAHNQNSTDVLFAVSADVSAIYGGTRYTTLPWVTPDGRNSIDAYIDSTNLYIKASNSTAGADEPARSYTYYYTILIP